MLTAVYEHCYEHYAFISRYNTPGSTLYKECVSYAKEELFDHLERITRALREDFQANEEQRQALEIIKGAAEISERSFQKDRYISELVNKEMLMYLKDAQNKAAFIRLTYV